MPAYCCRVDKSGALEYKESPTDDQPVKARSNRLTSPLFSLAGKLEFFRPPLESGLKVANTGKKTFRYEQESGPPTETIFNYSNV